MKWPEDVREQRALLDRLMPMVKKLARKRARLGRLIAEDELFDVARWAAEDAIAKYDAHKGDLGAYVFAKVDHALLNAIAKKRRRENSPVMTALRVAFVQAACLLPRGNLLHDGGEETFIHLEDVLLELSGAFGLGLLACPEQRYADSEAARLIRATLEKMAPYDREILWARFAEGRNLDEIAGQLGASPATVSRDIPKALIRLARRVHAPIRDPDRSDEESGSMGCPPDGLVGPSGSHAVGGSTGC